MGFTSGVTQLLEQRECLLQIACREPVVRAVHVDIAEVDHGPGFAGGIASLAEQAERGLEMASGILAPAEPHGGKTQVAKRVGLPCPRVRTAEERGGTLQVVSRLPVVTLMPADHAEAGQRLGLGSPVASLPAQAE